MKTWMFLRNPFLHVTDGSFLSAMGISNYHDSALSAAKADPFFLVMYNLYHPLHVAYKTVYDIWISQGGKQQARTLNITQLLDLLANTKIRNWDIFIQNLYAVNSPAYKELLPNHRKPFQNGKQVERIHALQGLINSIGSNEALATLKAEIVTFYNLLDAAHSGQKESKSTTKNMSGGLESARVAICVGQFANLGGLIQKYAATPDIIEQYFDVQAIRRSQQVIFTGQLKAGEVYTIVKHTFGETDEVILSNTGTTTLKFYLANARDAQPDATSITLASGDQTVLASALGKLADTYLTVLNTDALHAGEFGVELV